MKKAKFAITRFINRTGVASWRVEGRLSGVRIRKNLKTKEEAMAERASFEMNAIKTTFGLRSAVTCLSEEQLREAEGLFRRLQGNSRSLSFCVDYALANHHEPSRQQSLADGIVEYLTKKSREVTQQIISAPQATTIRRHLEVLKRQFPGVALTNLSATHLAGYCERGNASLKTYNNRRGILSTLFKFALQQDWIASNPVEKMPYHRIAHRRDSARTISADEARKLMSYVESYQDGRLVPFFALCLFAGIRPCLRSGEILKLRAEQVRLDTGVIHIEPEGSNEAKRHNSSEFSRLAPSISARAFPDNISSP
jgi:hypothetical protein